MRSCARAARIARLALLLSLLPVLLTSTLCAQSSAPAGQNAAPNGTEGQSLGDIARQLRAEKAAKEKADPPKYVLNQNTVSRTMPAGFKTAALPGGGLAVLVPNNAIADQSAAAAAHFHVLLDHPKRVVMISFGSAGTVPAGARLDDIPPDLEKHGMKVLNSEQKTINGNRALVLLLEITNKGFVFHEFQADVIAGTQGYAVTCGTRAEDFASVESTCRTVIESATVQ